MATRPLSTRKAQKVAFSIFCGWTGFIILFYYFTLNFNIYISISDSVSCNILLALGCMIFSNLLGYYQPKNETTLYVLVIAFILSLIIVSLTKVVLEYLIKDPLYISFLRISLPFRFLLVYVFLAWCALTNLLWYRLEEQSSTQERLLTTQNLAKEAELNKLRHQLQPHFLFNSLNSVYALTIVNPKEAGPMITKLASFLRGTLKRDDEIWVSVEEEMEYIQLYLDIEKVRFSHRLNVDIQIAQDTLGLKLPGTLLQPVVENAIKFGLYNTAAAITISIAVTAEQHMLTLKVQNPFDPGNRESGGTGFGLTAIRRRLYLLFADNSLLQTGATEDNQFITTLRIPQHDYDDPHRR